MGISDRLLGKKNVNGNPHIDAVHPRAALPGGEVRITGSGLRPVDLRRPKVQFGDVEGAVVISSDDFLVARVPPGASSGPVVVSTNGHSSNQHQIKVAVPIAENLHPVTNPAIDSEGNIFVTFSGSPPNAEMQSRTHSSAAIWSRIPALPAPANPLSNRSARCRKPKGPSR